MTLTEATALVSVRELPDGRRVALASSTALVDAWGVLLVDGKGAAQNLALGTFGHGLTPTPDGGHVLVSTLALVVGFIVGNVVHPGSGFNVDASTLDAHAVGER